MNLLLDAEDRAWLEAIAAHEKLSLSDIIRRAVREYGTKRGIKNPAKVAPK